MHNNRPGLPRMKDPRLTSLAFSLTLVLLVATASLDAQQRLPKASQRGSVSQTITGTTITVDYSRPMARGRDLFGGIVYWGEFWTPGANWATTIEADGDFRINGNDVPAGKYSLWFIVQENEWTVLMNGDDRVFHTQRPDPGQEVARFTVQPQPADHYLDGLSFYFPSVGPNYTTLSFHWGNTMVPFRVEVDPYPSVALEPAELEQYAGTYERSNGRRVTVTLANGVLTADGVVGFPAHMVPLGNDRFVMGTYINGEVAAIFQNEPTISFKSEDGRVSGFDFYRGGELRNSATRVQGGVGRRH